MDFTSALSASKKMKSVITTEINRTLYPVTLVCGADDRFAMPLAVTMFSALKNLRQGITPVLYIIDGGITAVKKTKIERVLKNTSRQFILNWVPFDLNRIGAVKETNIISKAAYLRILIPDLLPKDISKVIYLDCDMIVEGDFANLWDLEFVDEPAMGVQDYCFPYISTPSAISNFKDLQLPETATYCNSGLIVMNLNYWRAHGYTSLIFNYLNANSDHLQHFDQDGINVVIGGKWKLLDPQWNVSLSSIANFGQALSLNPTELASLRERITKNPYIIHFTSKHKPWHTGHKIKEALNVFYYDQPYRERYFYYLYQSGWFSKTFSRCWITHRKMILFLEYKLARRVKLSLAKIFNQTL